MPGLCRAGPPLWPVRQGNRGASPPGKTAATWCGHAARLCFPGVGRSLTKWRRDAFGSAAENVTRRLTLHASGAHHRHRLRAGWPRLGAGRQRNDVGPGPPSQGMKQNASRTHWVSVRFTETDLQDLSAQASQAGLSRSELIRRRVLHRPVISRADANTAGRIDQLGRLIKHLYPKDKGWASPEERRKFWRVLEDLQRTAQALRRRAPCSPKSSP